jgi:hypothetical protein
MAIKPKEKPGRVGRAGEGADQRRGGGSMANPYDARPLSAVPEAVVVVVSLILDQRAPEGGSMRRSRGQKRRATIDSKAE